MDKERKSEAKSLEIRFGMVFANWYERECTLHVVIDTARDNWFETSQIIMFNEKLALVLPGTANAEDVHLVVGQLTKEQILAGYDNYFEEPTSKIIVGEINKNSLKPERTIVF